MLARIKQRGEGEGRDKEWGVRRIHNMKCSMRKDSANSPQRQYVYGKAASAQRGDLSERLKNIIVYLALNSTEGGFSEEERLL